MRKIVVLLSFLLMVGLPLRAEQARETTLELIPGVPSVSGGELAVEVDPLLLRSEPQRVEIPLPDRRLLVATKSRVERVNSERFSWFGELRDGPVDGTVSLHYNEGRLRGAVRLADGSGYLLRGERGNYRVLEVAPATGSTCAVGLQSHAAPGPGLEVSRGGLERITAALDSRTDCTFLNKNLFLVNVMVLYPSSLQSQAQDVADYAVSEIADANNIFYNSNVKIRYQLAYVGQITGNQPGSGGTYPTLTALNWLNSQFSGAPNTEVELLADQYGADMITIVIPPDPNLNCGVANLPELNTSSQEVMYSSTQGPITGGTPFNDRAFSVVELDCGIIDHTFAHELGHAFGMRHDDEPRGADAILPWAYGHILEDGGKGPKATVMGCVGGSLPCYRLSLFSNPEKSFLGKPAGVHSPASNQAYNACVANTRAYHYATIR